eukprot:2481222-Alexandrium_andersonii.AAC.1
MCKAVLFAARNLHKSEPPSHEDRGGLRRRAKRGASKTRCSNIGGFRGAERAFSPLGELGPRPSRE